MSREFMQPLCRAYVQRAEILGFAPKPGKPASKKCDDDVMAYFQGAQNVLQLNKLPNAGYLEMFCQLILQPRGYSEIALLASDKYWEEQAKRAERAYEAAAEELYPDKK